MTATLTDRYVWAAARSAPEAQRRELERELRERIGDETDALLEQGASPEEAERAVLTELGDPVALAAGYVDRPLQLIGPRYYLVWWRLLKLLLAIVVPIAAVGVALGKAISGAPIGDVIGSAVVVSLSVVVHLGFWTTLVFAVLERSPAPEGQRGIDSLWTLDQLPAIHEPARTSRLADLIAAVFFLVVFAAAIVWQQFGIPWVPQLEAVPLLDPALWSFWLPYFIGIIGLEILFAVAVYAIGWTWWLAGVNVLLNVMFTVPALWLLVEGRLFNPAALEAMGWPWGDARPIVVAVAVVTVVGVAIADVVDGIVKTWRAGRARRTAA
ncbi:permease prefix domain 1-containing protein [Agromyces soli]|uniref:Permease prefix domain 1-containing protein n=1 Tax=Agromyces soli TaxID=659012 RepID=A0ABY4AP06_9MICO|nr:permease prefix domain 1-containing protein [Agromyces soli]UOE24895.1 permease prefix domain 1-containing protein [Agromyces soli]